MTTQKGAQEIGVGHTLPVHSEQVGEAGSGPPPTQTLDTRAVGPGRQGG